MTQDQTDNMEAAPAMGYTGADPADAVAGDTSKSSSADAMGQWAAFYASQGLHVFPLNGKVPRIRDWEKAASSDLATVAAWWRQWPDANIGWALGRDGYVAIDCDTKTEQGGLFEVEQWLATRNEDLPATLTATSGSGGQHLIFQLPEGVSVGNRTAVLPDVDVRGVGGQIVLAPSLHKSGQRYAWVGDFDLGRAVVLPQSLLDFIGTGNNGTGGKSPITGVDAVDLLRTGLAEGSRDDGVFALCVRQLKAGDSPPAVLALGREVARVSGWPLEEAEAKFRQALKWVAANPPDVLPDWHPDRLSQGEGSGASDELGATGSGANNDGDDLLAGLDTKTLELLQQAQRREQVKAILREQEARAAFTLPPSRFDLTEELAVPSEPVPWTIEALHKRGMNSSITAQYKTGKTTLTANLMRSLIDNEPFLGQLEVRALSGRVGFLNYELGEDQFRDWLRDVGVRNTDRGAVVNLRGYHVDLDSDIGREWLVGWLRDREVEAVIIDPFARAMGGDENDNVEVRRWTDNVDVIKREAGVRDLFLTAHTGRGGQERVRGATRIDDWADALWFMARPEGSERRYLSARGRDVAFDESELFFESATRRLTLGELGRGRKANKAADLVPAVLAALQSEGDGTNQGRLREVVTGNDGDVRRAIKAAIEDGLVRVERGSGRAQNHFMTETGLELLRSSSAASANLWGAP